jgi:hypothetical protein
MEEEKLRRHVDLIRMKPWGHILSIYTSSGCPLVETRDRRSETGFHGFALRVEPL